MQAQLEGGAGDLSQYTLVVPVVSLGNVGQLAADLLISSLELRRAGALHHDALLPVAGAAAFAHAAGLTRGLELFADPARKLACLQQRAPAAPGLQAELARALAAWIGEVGFKQVWVLGSLESMFRTDAQLAGPQLRFWSQDEALSAACTSQGLPALEGEWFQRSGDKPLEARLLPPWPLLAALAGARVPAAALLMFCSEGDNKPEAFALTGVAARALGLAGASSGEGAAAEAGGGAAAGPGGLAWRPPASWQFAFDRSDRPVVY